MNRRSFLASLCALGVSPTRSLLTKRGRPTPEEKAAIIREYIKTPQGRIGIAESMMDAASLTLTNEREAELIREHMAPPLTNEQRRRIVREYITTAAGREKLAAAMARPIRRRLREPPSDLRRIMGLNPI